MVYLLVRFSILLAVLTVTTAIEPLHEKQVHSRFGRRTIDHGLKTKFEVSQGRVQNIGKVDLQEPVQVLKRRGIDSSNGRLIKRHFLKPLKSRLIDNSKRKRQIENPTLNNDTTLLNQPQTLQMLRESAERGNISIDILQKKVIQESQIHIANLNRETSANLINSTTIPVSNVTELYSPPTMSLVTNENKPNESYIPNINTTSKSMPSSLEEKEVLLQSIVQSKETIEKPGIQKRFNITKRSKDYVNEEDLSESDYDENDDVEHSELDNDHSASNFILNGERKTRYPNKMDMKHKMIDSRPSKFVYRSRYQEKPPTKIHRLASFKDDDRSEVESPKIHRLESFKDNDRLEDENVPRSSKFIEFNQNAKRKALRPNSLFRDDSGMRYKQEELGDKGMSVDNDDDVSPSLDDDDHEDIPKISSFVKRTHASDTFDMLTPFNGVSFREVSVVRKSVPSTNDPLTEDRRFRKFSILYDDDGDEQLQEKRAITDIISITAASTSFDTLTTKNPDLPEPIASISEKMMKNMKISLPELKRRSVGKKARNIHQ